MVSLAINTVLHQQNHDRVKEEDLFLNLLLGLPVTTHTLPGNAGKQLIIEARLTLCPVGPCPGWQRRHSAALLLGLQYTGTGGPSSQLHPHHRGLLSRPLPWALGGRPVCSWTIAEATPIEERSTLMRSPSLSRCSWSCSALDMTMRRLLLRHPSIVEIRFRASFFSAEMKELCQESVCRLEVAFAQLWTFFLVVDLVQTPLEHLIRDHGRSRNALMVELWLAKQSDRWAPLDARDVLCPSSSGQRPHISAAFPSARSSTSGLGVRRRTRCAPPFSG